MKLIVLKNNVPFNEVSVLTDDLNEAYEIYVGRSEDCHVIIDDPLISRHHFVLKNENSKWICEKLSQLGIVTLNGSIVSKDEIRNGDEIKCGVYSLLVSGLPSLNTTQSKPVEPIYVAPVISEPVSQNIADDIDPLDELITEEVNKAIEEELPVSLENEILLDDEIAPNSLDDLGDSLSVQDLDQPVSEYSEELVPTSEFSEDQADSQNYEITTSESDDNESTRVLKTFVNYQLVLFGDHAPYDRFQIDQDEIFIGRDVKKCQIILDDPEVSSVHAVVRKKNADVSVEDLNSSNGTIINGERINRSQIVPGDEFIIGSTTFTLEIQSDLLESEYDRLMPVESGQVIETEEIQEEEVVSDGDGNISFESDASTEKSIIKRILKDPVKRKKAIYLLAGAVVVWLLLDSEEKPIEPSKTTENKEVTKPVDKTPKPKLNLSKELETARNTAYELGVSYFEQNKYFEALREFQIVIGIDSNYKKVQSYFEQTKVGLKRLEELDAQKRAEEERIKTKKLVEELLVKAREAVKDRNVPVAESYFTQIVEKDPENMEVSQLRLEIETWQKEEERKTLERAARETARKKMVDSLAPGKTFYLKKEWYRAILKLEEFLRIKGMDEDLIKEGSDMLSDAKNQLAADLGPLLGKARSLKEGQDLKSAYEAYLETLKVEPTNAEALNEIDDIKMQLESRSKRIYREAIIAESLSLFNDAKEKLQEVQQISPTDSEYYKKATDKLKNYLE